MAKSDAAAPKVPVALASVILSNSKQGGLVSKNFWRERLPRFASSIILTTLILAASAYGYFRPIDDWLEGVRYALLDRAPTGDVVFLEIDAASLQTVGVWPWPRTIHAAIVNRLTELGAKSMSFDIDFSAASTPQNDTAFAAALARAGGFAVLGAFEQSAGANAGTVVNVPIPALAAASSLVSVDVPLGAGNMLRDYPLSRLVGGKWIPSLGLALGRTGQRGSANLQGLFGLNFAINVQAIDQISAADLLVGKVSADRLRDRDVIIGASAQELRDFFVTPRFGLIPGGLVHALAAETLLQGLAMQDAPWQLEVGAILALALLFVFLGHRLSGVGWLSVVVATSAAVELVAFTLQREQALRVTSAPIQIALLTFVFAGIVVDLRLRRKLHAQAAREREFMRGMLQQVIADDFDGVVIVDETGKVLATSRMAQDFLSDGLNHVGSPALPAALAKLVRECFAVEAAGRSRAPASGQLATDMPGAGLRYLDYVVSMSSVDGENRRRVACLTFRDVTERRAEQERLKFLASHDPSTGAWLRHELIRNMENWLNQASPSESLTLILVEIRRFSAITNSFGDAVGERLLQSVFARLRAEGHQMIARIGDANFGLVVSNLKGGEVHSSCRALLARLGEPHVIDERKIATSVDVGVAMLSACDFQAETLLSQARIAQSVARGGAVNRYEVFSANMEAEFAEREWIETALRQALARGQLSLDYQPQFDLASGQCIGAEALIRWCHPDRGLISPGKFIAIAEESGVIVDIGRWVMRAACLEAANWPEALNVAVNVSPLQFESSELLGDVREALERSGLPPARLTVEITESAFVSGASATTALLNELRAQGIDIALDDFGTGYSSLSYLDRLPLDKIKIDQSFVNRMLDDQGAAAIVQSVLQLAGKLGKTVVAEGVETAAQARILRQFGCEIVQGYYFGRPMAAVDFRKTFTATPSGASLIGRIA
jgi:predicted signal transduction protein with EAL and GGDEF domain/CHASE2 domain-containing sensor protein